MPQFVIVFLCITVVVSWFRHLAWTIMGLINETMSVSDAVLAILGVVFAPFGIIHGFLLLTGIATP